MSFSSAALRRVQELPPRLPTVRLLSRLPAQVRTGRLSVSVSAIGPSLPLLRRHPWIVNQAHAAGLAVHVWTVNRESDMADVLDLGVDAVITDRPGVLLDQLRREGTERESRRSG